MGCHYTISDVRLNQSLRMGIGDTGLALQNGVWKDHSDSQLVVAQKLWGTHK